LLRPGAFNAAAHMSGKSNRHAGKPVIGIVGGIGAGKSTVAAELARLGCARIDADAIGHELLADPDVRRQIRRRWGEGVFGPEGAVDRRALGQIVFADAAELRALGAILHPRIRHRMEEQIARAQADRRVRGVVVDAAVLFEAGWDDLCTHRIFVRAPQAERARRARRQRGWDASAWRRREKMQISLDKKAAKSDYTVDNSSSLSHLHEQVRSLFHLIHAADRTRP
jgi:dephospho-CoA kinase